MIVRHRHWALRNRLLRSFCLAALVVLWSAGATHAEAPRRAEQSAGKKDGKKESDSKKVTGAGKNERRKIGKKKPGKVSKKPAGKAGKKPKIEIDAELQEKIDELLEREGKAGSRKAGKPSSRPRGEEPSAGGSGESAPINIPAIEDPDNDTPPEEREYEFSFKDVTYEQLIEGVARQTGLGVIGEAPKEGKVSFITTEKLNFEQLMDRVRTLLFNYKQLEPYTIVRKKTHLQVVRVTDYLRNVIPKDHMFRSVEHFQSASLADSELALVVYTPKSGSVAALSELRNYLPDYVRIAPLEGQNRVTIFALVRDIRKYLDLIEFFPSDGEDPRTLEKIELHNILPSEAITKLGALMELDGGAVATRPTGRKGKRSRSASPLDVMREPEVTLIPEDAQGVLIVRAMQDKIAEIKMLLPFIDVDTASPFVPVTIDLEHADPESLIATIQQILAVSEGSSPAASVRKPLRGKKRGAKVSTPVTAGEITLLPHPGGYAIIVLADDEGVTRVRALVAEFDKPHRHGPIELGLKHADASDVADAITQVLAMGQAPKGSRGVAADFQLVPNAAGDKLWFTGSKKDLVKVRELISVLDTAEDAVSLHTAELAFRKPSFVVDMLRQLDAGPGGRAVSKPKGKKRGRKSAVSVSKFTAVDEEMRLYAFCTDKEWDRYLSLIQQLDDDAEEREPFNRLELAHIEPSEAVEHLTQLLGSEGGSVQYVEMRDSLLIFDATEAQLADIETLLVEIDVPSDMEERTFEILHADPAELVTLIETLVGDPKTPRPRVKRPSAKGKRVAPPAVMSSENLSIIQVDRSLVVRATPAKMEKVVELIARYDVLDDSPLVRIPLTHIEPDRAVEWLQDVMGEPRGSGEDGLRFLPDAGALVVLGASESQIERVRTILTEFDRPSELVQRTFAIEHADPDELVTLIEALVSNQAGSSSPKRPKSKGKGGKRVSKTVKADDLHVVQIDRRLVVRTTPAKMQRVVEVIEEFDVEADRPSEMRVFENFPRGTDIDSMALTLSSAFSGSLPTGGRQKKGAAKGATGPLFIPEPAIGKLVVYADPATFEEIEELLAVLLVDVEMPEFEFDSIALDFADPEQLVQQVEPFLVIKVQRLIEAGQLPASPPEGETKSKSIKGGKKLGRSGASRPWFHLQPDPRNGRIAIAAPRVVIDEAMTLIADFDKAGEDPIFRTVEVHNADVAEMVTAIKEMMGSAGHKRGATQKKGVGRPSQAVPKTTLTVTTAPGGGAIVLHGTPDDVEQATAWITQLDEEAVAGRLIKVYDIANADMESLVNLIMNVVDTVPAGPRGKKVSRRPRTPNLPAEEDEFSTKITRVGIEVYIQADRITDTMLVAASPAKLARVDKIVAQFNEPSDEGSPLSTPSMAKRVFELKYADAFDAAFELDMVLEALWEPADLLPQVEEAFFGSGSALMVRYPDEDRFAEIEGLIAKYVDKREKAGPLKRKAFPVPSGMTAKETAHWLLLNHPELNIKIINLTRGKADEDYGIEELKPLKSARANPCVLPAAYHHSIDALLATVTAMNDEDDPDEKAPKAKATPDKGEKKELSGVDALLSEKATLFMEEAKDRPAERVTIEDPSEDEFEQVEIYYDEIENVLIIKGFEDVVEDMEGSLEELKEEIADLGTKPDIRIYRVKYIDVYTAQDIIEEMYNTPKQQQAQIRQMQQLRMQQQRRQQQQQQRQQQQQQQQGRGKEGADGKQVPQPPGARGGQQMNIPQIPAAAVRVYPHPRDRTLILRAETSQYPAIMELLATIDRPRPIESEHRIFKLEKLNAAEVETLLKSLLGLEQGRGQRRTPARGRGQQAATSPGGQLPSQLMQETDTASGPLGVDPKDIKISSNADANTIIVMAPKVALDYIEGLIKDLESEQIPERIPQHYEMQHADVQDVSGYLTTHFEEPGATPRRKPGQKGRQTRSGPRALNAPVFIAYERLNLLSVQATAEQIEEIDGLVEMLDVPSEADEWITVTLAHADAGVVADTLSSMFAGGTSAPRRGGKARRAPAAASGPKFIGEEGAKVLFFSAPTKLHERIHAVVAQLEEQSKVITTVRTITLEHAVPSSVAEAIESAYGSAGSTSRRGRGRRGGGAASTARFTIAADDSSKRLFVVADDQLFGEIESLAKSLDQPRSIGFDFKIYPLAHASARKIHEMLGNLVRDFMRSAGPKAGREPFAVEVDEKANALIVLGGPVVFDFVEDALKTVDIPANAQSPPGYLMVALKNANAQELAQSINRIWSQRNLPPGETAPQAEASRTLNMLYVRGTQEQVDQIKKEFIDPLEEHAPAKLLTEVITMEHAQPEAVAESINQFFQAKADAFRRLGRDSNVSPLEFTVVVSPEVDTKQLIVQASVENMEFIKTRVSELDRPEIGLASATSMKIYPVKYADPNAVVTIIREWSRSRTQGAGGRNRRVAPRDIVVAVAEHATQSVVVTASTSNHVIVQELIDGLDNEELATGQRKRQVIRLDHANASEVANQLSQVFRQTRRKRGDAGPTFIAAPKTNSIVASLNQGEFDEVMELLEAIDVESGLETQRLTVPYPLEFADPGSINNVILNQFRWDRRTQPSPSELVTSAIDWGTRSVIVTASQKNHEIISKMIEEVDIESTIKKELYIHRLTKANADDVARALQNAYRGRRRTGRGETPVQITAEPQTNSLIISANATEMAELTELIESIDVEPEASRQRQLKSIKLTYANPWSVQDAINRLFRGISRNPKDQVTVVPEYGANAVIVSASPENMTRVEELIDTIDSSDTNQREVHVVNIEHADPSGVARALNDIYVRSAQRSRGGEQPISISEIQGSKAVLVKASATDMARIMGTVKDLDIDAFEAGESVRVVQLERSDASEMKTAVENMLAKRGGGGRGRRGGELIGDIRVSILTQQNALVLSGNIDAVEKLEATIMEMDAEAGEGTHAQLIRLTYADPGQLLPILQEMFADQRGGGRRGRGRTPPVITASQAPKGLFVRADPMDFADITAVVTELDVEEAQAGEMFRIIPVPQGIDIEQLAADLERGLNDSAQEQYGQGGGGRSGRGRRSSVPSVTIMADRRSRILFVSGSAAMFDEVEKAVAAMEATGPAGPTTVRVIKTTMLNVEDVRRILEQMKGEGSGSSARRGSSRSRSRSGSGRRPSGRSGRRGRGR